jgi:hypothetical protein
MGLVSTTVAGLGTPEIDGTIGIVRVGTWPDTHDERLKWNLVQGKWIGEARLLCQSIDGDFMVTTQPNWAFLNDPSTTFAGMMIRTLPFADALWNAGLRLQDRCSARFYIAAGLPIHIATWFYQFNNGDYVVFGNDAGATVWPAGSGQTVINPPGGPIRQQDGSDHFTVGGVNYPYVANIGHGTELITSSTIQVEWQSSGWTNVVFTVPNNDGSPTATPASLTKHHLYPTVYAYRAGAPGPGQGEIATYSYEMRWTS